MSLLWEPKDERIKKIEKLKTLASTVDGLPRLLKGVGDEIGKQFHTSLNALQGYQEEQHKEVMRSHVAAEENIMAAVAVAMERQKTEILEKLQEGQLQTLKSVGDMLVKLDGKLGGLAETGEESRAIGLGIADIIHKTIDSLSEGLVNLSTVTESAPAHKEEHRENDMASADHFSRSDRM